ncbi:intermembrane lipid transfer protein VPS13 isoform X2 [Salvia miltiorrhiza]|nr:intermembrane lipid transfer protein VPS13 isoform X2 [Salvia miltiorrhiza]
MDAIKRREYASKKAQLAAAELAKLSRRVCDNQTGKSFISYITAKILDSIQVSIRNVHVLYCEKQSAAEEILFGLKFSSLTIMKQTAFGSTTAKLKGGQVNKLIEIQDLELYCDTSGKAGGSKMENSHNSNIMGREELEDNKYLSILAPLNVSVSLSVNRSGKLLNDAPQYTVNIELASMATSMDEDQLQHILALLDYVSLCQLRENYGGYRPWWSPLKEKLKGWQKAWWHYAQESVLSDVRRRVRRTSWKYFGERLNSRRKYVNLYKAKLKCLRHDQMIDEDVQRELEEMEKETDIDDILNYRAVAEQELEDFLVKPSSRYGSNGGNMDKSVEDDQPPSKPRGWLNWLSYGMLGAGGTDVTNQFSGVISDDVIKDIYEATKFYPAPVVVGDSAMMEEVYFSSVKINISDIHTKLRSMKLGHSIADLMLTGISIEAKVWEQSAVITASVNSAKMLNPFNSQIILSSKKMNSEDDIFEKQRPSLDIKVDMPPPSSDINLSVKVTLSPTELLCDSEFLKNILDFLDVLHHMSFQQQRILLSLNGIDDLNSRLLSKLDYVLSNRKKITWDINLLNTAINLPWGHANIGGHNMVVVIAVISFTSKPEIDSSASIMGDTSQPLHYVGSGPTGDSEFGFQFQNLYDHFEILISDTEINLIMPSSATLPLIEKFSASANLVSCTLPDEPVLKFLEAHVQVPSLVAHFSASIYGEIMGLISQFNILLPPDSSDSVKQKSNGSKASENTWFSVDASLDAIYLLVNLEDNLADGCTLNFNCQKLGVWYDQRDFPDCWVSLQACQVTASSTKDGWESHVLYSSIPGSGSVNQHNMSVDGQNGYFEDETSLAAQCIFLHFEAVRNTPWILQKYTLCASDFEIHCYPFIVQKLVGFFDEIALYGESNFDGKKYNVEDENSAVYDFELEKHSFANGIGLNESANTPLDHIPLTTFVDGKSFCNLENLVDDMRLKFSETLNLRDQKFRPSKVSLPDRTMVFSTPPKNSNLDSDSSMRNFINRDSVLVNLNLGSITMHFHDSSCIIGTIVVPLAKSVITISKDMLDIVCSTEGVFLSTSWWPKITNEFLWGPLSSNLSPILTISLKKKNTPLQNSHSELSFYVQHVSCMLPPDFLAMLIGYFSLPDWSPYELVLPTDTMDIQDSITFSFEIVDCSVITPAEDDFCRLLQIDIKQLSVAFSENSDRSSLTKNIPSSCCISAGKFSDRNQCLDFFGCDLSLSVLLLAKDVVNPLDRCQKHVLVSSLTADVWVRIPYFSGSDSASYPVCIMALVSDCLIDIEEERTLAGLDALGYVIDQFSLVEQESKMFTYDVVQFLQTKKQIMEHSALLPKSSDVTTNEMRFCVRSLSLRLHQLKRDSTCSEIIAEAEMHFVCSLSLINGNPHFFDISFSSAALFSMLNSVALAEFSCTDSGSSVLDMILTVSRHGENVIILSFPSLDVWLYFPDWNEVIDLLVSFSKKLSTQISGASVEGLSSVTVDNCQSVASDSQSHVPLEDISEVAGSSILTLEHVGLSIHFPALVSRDAYNMFGSPHVHDLPPGDVCGIPSGNQNCFISISLQSRYSELVGDGKSVKLAINSDCTSAVLKLLSGDTAQSWPLFQLSKTYLEAEVFEYQTENLSMNLFIRSDSLDLSLGNHILYLFYFTWFEKVENTPSQFNIKRMEIKAQLRRLSLHLNDWKTSNGPLLEFLVRNSIFWSTVTEDGIEGSLGCDLQVNYYNIDKVLWEPFLEPWKFQLSMSRKEDERALFNGTITTDINLESKTHLNLNLNEPIVEVVSRAVEMVKDVWSLTEMTESPDLPSSQITKGAGTRRYAPYMLQNLTTLPLLYACQQKLGADDLDVSPSKGVLQPGSSTLIYINESPEELLFRYRPVQSSDRLNDKQLVEAAHRFVTFQLEGTSVPSAPISMDLVGRSYFEVQFLKSSHVPEFQSDANSIRNRMNEGNGGSDTTKGFAIPVVIDVSVQRFTKLMRLYSTVVILNSTSVVLEVRFDIPFGLSPKILGPIYPGQEFPLPLHLAESGCIRWRPIGDSFLWSEAYNISSIISRDVKIGFLRSFVCYPSLPSSEAFRCCISVNGQCLSPVGCRKRAYSAIGVDSGKQCRDSHIQSSENLEIPRNRLLYQVMLTSPLVLKNYLMKSMSVTLEDAGVTRTAFLSEVETSFYHIDSSHDFSITFQMQGFKPSTLKYPRAESFSEKARFSGTKFSVSEIVKFESQFSNGPLYVTMEKVMDAVSGSRELFISVPFLLFNCTGFPLALSSSGNEMKGYSCIVPSCYDLDEKNVLFKKKDGLSLIFSDHDVPASGSTSEATLNASDLVESGSKKVSACLFSPDPDSYSGEVWVKLSRHVPSVIENLQKYSWSSPFSLVPPTGSTSVLVPQPSKVSGYVLSVSAVAAPFSGRTKIITFQPRYVIVNACTKILCYKQKGTDSSFHLEAGKHSYIQWMDSKRELLLSVRFDEPGWEWSGCFLPEQLGDTQLKVRNYMTAAVCMLRVEVRNADVSVGEEKIVGSTTGNSGTNLILLSDDDTGFMPYRIDNHSRERLRIYQPKCESFETVIHSYTSTPYAWDEPCYPHRLVVEVPGERILGSYAIDDVSAHSLVYLPATSEKPERKLLISVHSEGAIKVLSIIDSSYHVLNDLKRLHVPQLKDNGKLAQEYESFVNYKEKVSVDIPFLGVSLMNSHPEEILFASAQNTKLTFVQSLDQQQFSFQIASLQIDNQLRTTPYPVVLSFNSGNKGNMVNGMKLKDSSKLISGSTNQTATSSLHEPVFSLGAAKWRNTETSLVSFESISLRMADLYLEIEQEIVLRLFEFCKTVSSRLQSRVYQYVGSTQNLLFPELDITGETSRNAPYSARLDEKYTNNTGTTILVEDHKRKYLLPLIVPIGAPWQQIHLAARKQKKVYVELFDMGPIKLTLSFSSSPWILRDGVLTSGESLIHRGLMALADVEGAKIHFKELVLSHQIASWETFQEILVSHYTRQFLHEMYKVFGSAGVIGNPVGFARSLGLGIKDFFSLPIWSVIQSPAGLITGMAQGTTSLLSNTVYAISDATSQFSRAAHKGIVAFTFDDQTATMIERQQKGMSSRSKGVINEFLEGLTGVLQSPIKGAEKHGLPGVLSGIAVGVTGLVARPAASILEVTGKTAQSIRNRSRIYQMGYRCFRVRLPRPLSTESSLKPYSWDEAVGTYILTETDVNLRDETLVICKALKQCGQYVLITGRLILVVSCPSLIESEGVPADPKWEILSEIGLDSVILADNDGEVVHIVGSGSDTTSFRQNPIRGNDAAKGKLWNSSHTPLPFLQTNLELASEEEADDFLRVLRGMIESGREQGWGAKYILHQSNIR